MAQHPLLNSDKEKMLFCGWWNAYLQQLVLIYLWITISHLFVCFPTLELTTFEQHLCSTKLVYANALSLGKNSCKKRKVATLNSAHQAKKQWNFDSGWLERQQCDLHSFFWILWTKRFWSINEKIYSRTTTKSVPLLQTKLGFCQQIGPERGQLLHPNEKMEVVPLCLNGRCCYSGCVGIVSY